MSRHPPTGRSASARGGSSYLGGVTGGSTIPAQKSGNGQIVLSY